ncbi:MAG: hypothetical protein GY842_15545, partial [bacterium]|nr:hypothetical protein [bacterium]
MRRKVVSIALGGVLACSVGAAVRADVAVVIEHRYTVGNNNFSAFAYDSNLDPHEFITTGYGFGKDLRWSRVLEDSVEPWDMEGEVLMDSGQIEFFGRDGFPSYSLSYNAWGMNFNP